MVSARLRLMATMFNSVDIGNNYCQLEAFLCWLHISNP